jgi:hypothetical protein
MYSPLQLLGKGSVETYGGNENIRDDKRTVARVVFRRSPCRIKEKYANSSSQNFFFIYLFVYLGLACLTMLLIAYIM